MAKGFQVFVKGAKFLAAPEGYTPEEYYEDGFERIKTCKSLRTAERTLEKVIGRKIYGLLATKAEWATYGVHGSVTILERKYWTTERDAYIMEVS